MSSSATACSTCASRCCIEYTVSVVGSDVWHIAANLNLAPPQFLVHFPIREAAANGFKLDHSDTRYDIALDKVPVDAPHQPCIFLMGLPGGGGRCGIHAYRPQVCQTYPAFLNGDVVTLRDDVLCPEGAWKLSQMKVGKWRDQMEGFLMQRDIYERVVACWNERVDAAVPGRRFTISEFYDFLMNVYTHLAKLEAAMSDEERTLVQHEWNELRAVCQENPLNTDALPAWGDSRLGVFFAALISLFAEFSPCEMADGEDVVENQTASTAVATM